MYKKMRIFALWEKLTIFASDVIYIFSLFLMIGKFIRTVLVFALGGVVWGYIVYSNIDTILDVGLESALNTTLDSVYANVEGNLNQAWEQVSAQTSASAQDWIQGQKDSIRNSLESEREAIKTQAIDSAQRFVQEQISSLFGG